METMSRGGPGLPTSLSGGGLAHISAEVCKKSTGGDVLIKRQFFLAVLPFSLFKYNVKSPVKRRSGIFPRLLSVDSQTERHNQRR